jgi:hypothetical protein
MGREEFLARAREAARAEAEKRRREADEEAHSVAEVNRTADALVAALSHLVGLRLRTGGVAKLDRRHADGNSRTAGVTLRGGGHGLTFFCKELGYGSGAPAGLGLGCVERNDELVTLQQAAAAAETWLLGLVDPDQGAPPTKDYDAVLAAAGRLQLRLYDAVGDMGPSSICALAGRVFGKGDPDVTLIHNYFTEDGPEGSTEDDDDGQPPF